jgi:hypothetical protein
MRFTAFLETRLNPGMRGGGDIEGLGGTGGIGCLCCVVEMCRISFSRTLYPVREKLFYPNPTLRQPYLAHLYSVAPTTRDMPYV